MPHVFQLFGFHPSSKKSFELGSKFIKDCFSNDGSNKNDNGPWAYKIDTKLNFNLFDYNITTYKIPQAFSLKEKEEV
ncbi:hypothetical protein K502DRAFT_326680 [Neoconidiobolus thromboides FSU 785]|nr:hypothetical protein K502DRAFT_326680 [Neoconidiobolus thromboides FSU 785]